MPRVRDILLLGLTAACVAAGALLPGGTAALQDRGLDQRVETRALDPVQLLIRQDLSPTQLLGLASGPHTQVAWEGDTDMTLEDVTTSMAFLLWEMAQAGLIPDTGDLWTPDLWEVETGPFLAVAEDGSQAALLWVCVWDNPGDGVYTLWIDDTTRLLCGIRRKGRVSQSAPFSDPKEALVSWSEFLFNHYSMYPQLDPVEDWSRSQVTVPLTFTNGDGPQDTCTVALTLEGADFSFVI